MTTFETASRGANGGAANGNANGGSGIRATSPPSSFVPPPKGYFSPTPTRTTTAVNNGLLQQGKSSGAVAINSATDVDATAAQGNTASPADGRASEPSSVPRPSSRPRRESIGQMRRKASDSATAAASAGGIGLSFASRGGQPIPVTRGVSRGLSMSPRAGADGPSSGPAFPASLGSAAEALSLPASVLNSGAKHGRPTGHTHFGQECYGPEPGETVPNPPANLAKHTPGSVPSSDPNGSGTAALLAAAAANTRRGSTAGDSSVEGADEDASTQGSTARTSGGKELPIHRCESCAKVYRHPSCLVKHRWEHTVYWKEASKFLMSKHQQVQLLEAAAILVNLDGDARSLPEEKALWPAAVSPASSGLLGSDRVNFDKLMQRKAAYRGRTPSIAGDSYREDSVDADAASVASSAPRSATAGLSPLNSFSKLGLSGTPVLRGANGAPLQPSQSFSNTPYSFGSLSSHRINSDVQHLTLDESDERTMPADAKGQQRDRSGSAETNDDDDESGDGIRTGDKKWGLHEDAIAEMDMEE